MQHSYATIAKLPLFRGHLYNWYTTDTLEALEPITVSSVDSGNFVASLYTLKTGTLGLLQRPLLDPRLFAGLESHLRLLQSLENVPASLAALRAPEAGNAEAWLAWIFSSETQAAFANLPPYTEPSLDELLWWSNETRSRIQAIAALVNDYLPWLKPQYASLHDGLFEKLPVDAALRPIAAVAASGMPPVPSLAETPAFATALEQRLTRPQLMPETGDTAALMEQLRADLPRPRISAFARSSKTCTSSPLKLAALPTKRTSPSSSTKTGCCSRSATNFPRVRFTGRVTTCLRRKRASLLISPSRAASFRNRAGSRCRASTPRPMVVRCCSRGPARCSNTSCRRCGCEATRRP